MNDKQIVALFYGGLSIKQLAKRYYDEKNIDKPKKNRVTKVDALFAIQSALLEDLRNTYSKNRKTGGKQ